MFNEINEACIIFFLSCKTSNSVVFISLLDEVSWEFKWKQEDDAELHGPFNSHQMLQWADDGYFENGVYVRKCGASTSEFYSSTRIDFGLYL